jgi:hypothetical protein
MNGGIRALTPPRPRLVSVFRFSSLLLRTVQSSPVRSSGRLGLGLGLLLLAAVAALAFDPWTQIDGPGYQRLVGSLLQRVACQ